MRLTRSIVTLTLAGAFLACATNKLEPTSGSEPFDWREIVKSLKSPSVKADLPIPKRVTLSNSMQVLLIPNHELPLVNIEAMVKAGSLWEPSDKAGLAAMAGAAIRSGGTKKRSPDMLNEELEDLAGKVGVSIGLESGGASLSALSSNWLKVLAIFGDVIMNPAFDKDRFEIIRAKMIDGVRRENDEPSQIASRSLKTLLYPDSPYGRNPTIKTLSSIRVKDARDFHSRYFAPNSFILGITGDFDEATIIDDLENVFGSWKKRNINFPPTPSVDESHHKGGIWIADKDVPQAVIRVGRLTIKRTNPDYYPLRVMNEILGGGGFSSRLTKAIRVDRGLAYSVWSYVNGGRWAPGQYMMGADTKVESAAEVAGLIKKEVTKIRSVKVSNEEITVAKDSIVNSFVFIFDTPQRIMGQWLTVDYYGMPESYLLDYRKRIASVTKGDLLRVAKEHLNPDSLKFVIVGPKEKLTEALTPFGNVEFINLSVQNDPHK